MLGKDFRNLAEAVTATYGNNPWFFLRELAQNSRDAGARSIRVKTERTAAGLEILTFADDGRGMSLAHARSFLFRLYASDKAEDKMSAGKYGIGFWTILSFGPSLVNLQSRSKKNSWAVALDAGLNAQFGPCSLSGTGTSVVLTRPAVFATANEFSRVLENELRAYCQYLRRNDRRGTQLPVFFHDQNITVPMSLPGPLSLSFHSGPVEGAVGMADQPLVRLYARGLPVWQGALLDQMSHLQPAADNQSEISPGLAPLFLLNGNQLDVSFSRNLVLENKALEKVRKTAEKALQRLLATSMESAFPRNRFRRGCDRLQIFFSRLWRPGWKLLPLVLLIMLPLEMIILNRFFPAKNAGPRTVFSLRTDPASYAGATVAMSFSETTMRFAFQPPVSCWFKVFAAAEYDLQSGFIRRDESFLSPPLPFQSCSPEKTMRMRLSNSGSGRVFLPLPPGHAIDPASVMLTNGLRLPLSSNSQGESSVDIPENNITVTYQSCPRPPNQELAFAEISNLTRLPDGLEWPAALEESLHAGRFLTVAEKLSLAGTLVRKLLSYDTSGSTVQAYQQSAPGQPWLAKVLAIGKGDCDILNGVHVLLLRKLGIPARLVIGLIGARGRIQPGLHAWSEYFDSAWKIYDASADAAQTAMPLPEIETSPRADSLVHAASSRSPEPGAVDFGDLLVPALFIAVLALAFIFILKRNTLRRPASEMKRIPAPAAKEFMLPVIRQALLHPEFYGRESPLWNHRFLPTANGKPIAIRQALALLRRGRLLFFTSQNQLVAALSGSGMGMLDLSQEIFAPLRHLLTGAINLDRLCRLQPQPPAAGSKAADHLLAAVNIFLRRNFFKPAICLLSPGLREADFLNVSLPVTPRQSRVFFPRRFIAVNPQGKEVNQLSVLYTSNPALAIFKFLRVLHAESLLPAADADAFLKKAARCLLHRYRGLKT